MKKNKKSWKRERASRRYRILVRMNMGGEVEGVISSDSFHQLVFYFNDFRGKFSFLKFKKLFFSFIMFYGSN